MKKEEEIIKMRCGKENPFRVPQGYFDDFATKLMAQLPEKEEKVIKLVPKHNRWHTLRPMLYIAACICAAIFSVTLVMKHNSHEQNNGVNTARMEIQQNSSNDYVDEAVDYAMIDNHEIYACVTNQQ
jgi:hypothetical protein